jgi:hypothetical protein
MTADASAHAGHPASPLVISFYGDGGSMIGEPLFHFFNTVPIFGPRTELCHIMTRHGSDKGSGWHNYTMLYHSLLYQRRFEITNIFELGLGTNFTDIPFNRGPGASPGASLRGWREYFPWAQIVGADIDRRVLFAEERISTLYVDQLDKNAIAEMWAAAGEEGQFDIVIDDGLHTFEANTCFFENSYKYVRKCGYYVIEDIVLDQANLQRFHEYFRKLNVCGTLVRIPNPYNTYDNCLAIFRPT